MTRLTEDDLRQCPDDLKDFNERLTKVANLGLLELTLLATGMTEREYRSKANALKSVAVIPISAGQGIIGGFSKKVAQVGTFLGLPSKVTRATDVAGWGEAMGQGSEMVLCADDETFLAVNMVSRKIVNNSSATGEIYAAALSAAAGGVSGHLVGVVGLGPVGRAAANWLCKQGADLAVYDKDQDRQSSFLSQWDGSRVRGLGSVDELLDQTDLAIDATNSSDIIQTRHLKRSLILSAPGVPLGIDDPGSPMVRLIHDPLYLGVAAMMIQALV